MEPKNTLTIDDYEELVKITEDVLDILDHQELLDAHHHLLVLWGYKTEKTNMTDRERLYEIRGYIQETIRKLEKDTRLAVAKLKIIQKKLSPAPKRRK